jgi:hypothetical protein
MSEDATSASPQNPSPRRSNRRLLLIGIAMAIGLFALIALNMK